jgi:hypothetical protein
VLSIRTGVLTDKRRKVVFVFPEQSLQQALQVILTLSSHCGAALQVI